MAVTILPDVFGALLTRLKVNAAVVALASTRIADEVRSDWDFKPRENAKHAVVINGPIGGPGEMERPLYRERYDVWSYGKNRLEALRMARTVRAALIPPDGGAIAFAVGAAHIGNIVEESGPIRLVDPDTGWVYVVQPYLVTYSIRSVA